MISKQDNLNKIKSALPAIAAVVLLYVFFHIAGIGCPIKFVTGISCMGCGMTRAYLSLLRLDFAEAFHYHPLFLLPILAAVMYFFKRRIPEKIYTIWLFTLIALFSIIYLLRLADPADQVVVFEPEQGLICRIASALLGYLKRAG